ncbi:MAG: ParB N-terminal domain-containing protein, partial [Victivallaceae bacterium]|nr:ParB N-terminal domain-containing protein [Victivallaceae bacterium]
MQQVKLSTLKHHALADLLPMLAEDHPESQALLASVAQDGILTPLIVDEDGKILDGRHRYRAAKTLGLETVPVEVVKNSEAATTALQTAINRRQFDLGQKALLIATMFPKSEEERKARSLSNLKKGSIPHETPKPLESVSG